MPEPVRVAVFRASYEEVLAFLKHEDDKINRVLTALAFLTAAAVALYIFSRGQTPPTTLPLRGTTLTAGDLFFGSFVIGLVGALLAAVAALDPTSFYPRFLGSRSEPKSVLYYRAIGQDDIAEPTDDVPDGRSRWAEIAARSDEQLWALLGDSYHEDARRLAHRARHKVYRFTECNAFVELAIASLALLGLVRLGNRSDEAGWWLVSLVLIAYAWLPAYDFLVLIRRNFPDVGREYMTDRTCSWWMSLTLFFIPTAVVTSILVATQHRHWAAIVYVFASTLVLRLLSLHLRRPRWLGIPAPLVCALATFAGGLAILIWLWT